MRRGSITLTLCMILLVLLSLISAALYSVRLSAARVALSCGLEQSLYSLFSRYDRKLFQKYGLLFMDAGYGDTDLHLGKVLDQIGSDAAYVINPEKNSIAGAGSDILGIRMTGSEMTGYVLATDNGGEAYVRQVCSIMEKKLGAAALEEIKNSLFTDNQQSSQTDADSGKIREEDADVYYEEDRAAAVAAGKETEEGPQETVVPDGFENPIEKIDSLKKEGILQLVLPENAELSNASVDWSVLAGKRVLQTGMNMLPNASGLAGQNLILLEYLSEFFPCYLSKGEQNGLKYQIEAVIGGKDRDEENLRSVVRRLLVMREGANLLYLMTDPDRRAEADEMALMISTAFFSPEAAPVVSFALKAAWAFGESILDLRELYDGGRVALVKNDETWQLSLEHLGDLMETGDKERKSAKNGLDYKGYLRILLSTESEEKLTNGLIALTEYNMRQNAGEPGFCMDNCMDAAEVELTAEIGRIKYSIRRSYGYDMEV